MHIERDVFLGKQGQSIGAGVYSRIKAAADFCLACLLFAAALPVIALLAMLVKRSSPGPAFYQQTRLGLGGRQFQIWKLRTMTHNCEAHTGPVWSGENDPRVTPIGRILRDTHLDELPQLWNVLRGEMSLIGPRPERPEIARRLELAVPGFGLRLGIKPGLTGLAQLRLPPDQDVAQVPQKLAQDLYYLRNHGLFLDLRILISTIFFMISAGSCCFSSLMLPGMAPATQQPMPRQERPVRWAEPDSSAEPAFSETRVEVSAAA